MQTVSMQSTYNDKCAAARKKVCIRPGEFIIWSRLWRIHSFLRISGAPETQLCGCIFKWPQCVVNAKLYFQAIPAAACRRFIHIQVDVLI